jgi:hypothetical protein
MRSPELLLLLANIDMDILFQNKTGNTPLMVHLGTSNMEDIS